MRKLISILMLTVLALSFVIISPTKVSAGTPPTIINYGISPLYSDVGVVVTHWMTYLDVDNDSPAAGYPKGAKSGSAWPFLVWSANDSSDTCYSDGKQYSGNYYYYPVIGVTFFIFTVKSVNETNIVNVGGANTIINRMLPSTSIPFGVFPASNYPTNYTFTFNYTSEWQYSPKYIDLWLDDVVYNMTKNNSLDNDYRDGCMYHIVLFLDIGTHNYTFHWAESLADGAYGDRNSGAHWLIVIEEPTSLDNKFIFAIVLLALIFAIILIIFLTKK